MSPVWLSDTPPWSITVAVWVSVYVAFEVPRKLVDVRFEVAGNASWPTIAVPELELPESV